MRMSLAIWISFRVDAVALGSAHEALGRGTHLASAEWDPDGDGWSAALSVAGSAA
jgi:hypothetical protein